MPQRGEWWTNLLLTYAGPYYIRKYLGNGEYAVWDYFYKQYRNIVVYKEQINLWKRIA